MQEDKKMHRQPQANFPKIGKDEIITHRWKMTNPQPQGKYGTFHGKMKQKNNYMVNIEW